MERKQYLSPCIHITEIEEIMDYYSRGVVADEQGIPYGGVDEEGTQVAGANCYNVWDDTRDERDDYRRHRIMY